MTLASLSNDDAADIAYGRSTRDQKFSPTRYVTVGYATLVLSFGVVGIWAYTAPLASGVVATGTVSVESSRKTVQHLEGGIVAEIMAREGEIVEAGQAIMRLDSTQAQSNYDFLSARLSMLQAQEARLIAESTNAETIELDEELLTSGDEAVGKVVALQQTLFADRTNSRDGQIAIFTSRIDQLHVAIEGLTLQRDAITLQLSSISAEMERMTRGQENGVVSTNQLSSVQRAQLEMQGTLGGLTSEIAKLHQTISETELQIVQLQQEFVERASGELRDLREMYNETAERTNVARDVLERTIVRAPVRGKLQNIRFHTIGGVVRPAEPVMDIIPLDDDLIITAQIRPIDIDSVSVGLEAEVRFQAFSAKTTPAVFGTIAVVSQDVIEPTTSNGLPYYSARIEVGEDQVPFDIRERLLPGMPVDVIVSTGERTFFDYLVRPLSDMFYKGMREK